MEKKQSTPVGDFVKEAAWGGLIISPAVDIAFRMFEKVPFKEAFKDSFATAQGWKRNAIWGGVFGVIGVTINGIMGRYKPQPEIVAAPPSPMVEARGPLIEQPAEQPGKFAQKEAARREEAAEQAASVA